MQTSDGQTRDQSAQIPPCGRRIGRYFFVLDGLTPTYSASRMSPTAGACGGTFGWSN